MPVDLDVGGLYGARINLWVEDKLTRDYLGALWNEPAVKFLVAGGRNGIAAILEDAKARGVTNSLVVGLVDRDFGGSNSDRWDNPDLRRFVLPCHEIENYLLDARALAASPTNTRRLTAGQIDDFLEAEAQKQCWWMACRGVIAWIHERVEAGFPPHPKFAAIKFESDARKAIVESDWFQTLPTRASEITVPGIEPILRDLYARARKQVNDGSWRQEFSGREFLRETCNRIRGSHPSTPKYLLTRQTAADVEADLAKQIAAWQRRENAIPPDLVELLAVLKARG